MTITTSKLTQAAGLSAIVAGLLFSAVQIKHPDLDITFVTTTEFKVRQTMKVLFSALSLVGITGMYLRQVKQTGVLGLLGYVVFSVGYLAMLSIEVIAAVVLPSIANTAPGYVTDVFAVATGGHAAGDIGLMQPLISVMGVGFLGGSVLFGIALFRANVLARWAGALLAVAAVATAISPQLPINQRLFAIPTGVALVGLGYSLWRGQRSPATVSQPSNVSSQLDPAGA
ncbi:MAG: hypothetical protein ABI438_01600 [Dermatophilaceae bacterium]